jgi:hypothetical protein
MKQKSFDCENWYLHSQKYFLQIIFSYFYSELLKYIYQKWKEKFQPSIKTFPISKFCMHGSLEAILLTL